MSDETGAKFRFKAGDRVRRSGGSYAFPGVVLSAFANTLGRRLYAVEHRTEAGMIHVFREADLVADPQEGA